MKMLSQENVTHLNGCIFVINKFPRRTMKCVFNEVPGNPSINIGSPLYHHTRDQNLTVEIDLKPLVLIICCWYPGWILVKNCFRRYKAPPETWCCNLVTSYVTRFNAKGLLACQRRSWNITKRGTLLRIRAAML